MKPPADAVRTVGKGPDLLLIHGTAADRTSWNVLVRLLRAHFRVTTYDRRGTRGWPVATEVEPHAVEEHAADAADTIDQLGLGSVFVCGVSFGGTVALELVRQRPDLVRAAALFEPRLVALDALAGRRTPFLVQFDRLVSRGEGEQAAEDFQRRLMSDALWKRLPEQVKAQTRKAWRQIYGDLVAIATYRPRYAELGGIDVPVLLLRGGRSHPVFDATLRALAAALGRSRRETIPSASHQLDGQAWRELAAALVKLVEL